MTLTEIRNQVMTCFEEGQTVNLKIKGETQSPDKIVIGRVEKFYPKFVSVRHDGYLESFSYLEFLKIASIAKVNIPKKLIKAAGA